MQLLYCRWFGIPSYHVQKLFRELQGTAYLPTLVKTNPESQVSLPCLGQGAALATIYWDATCAVLLWAGYSYSFHLMRLKECLP